MSRCSVQVRLADLLRLTAFLSHHHTPSGFIHEQEGHSLLGLSSATPADLLVLLVCLYLTVW